MFASVATSAEQTHNNPQLRCIHIHQLFRILYTLFRLDTVSIYWWWCINFCRVQGRPVQRPRGLRRGLRQVQVRRPIYIYIYIYVCMYVCMYVCIYIYIIHVYKHSLSLYTYIYIYNMIFPLIIRPVRRGRLRDPELPGLHREREELLRPSPTGYDVVIIVL